MLSEEAFARITAAIEALNPARGPKLALTPAELDMFFVALRDVPDAAANALFMAVVDECETRPSPKQLRDLARGVIHGPDPDATEAYLKLQEAIRQHGYLREPLFEDATLAYLVAALGWQNICTDETPPGVFRGQFVRMYAERRAGRQAEGLRQLHQEFKAALLAGEPAAALLEGGTE